MNWRIIDNFLFQLATIIEGKTQKKIFKALLNWLSAELINQLINVKALKIFFLRFSFNSFVMESIMIT